MLLHFSLSSHVDYTSQTVKLEQCAHNACGGVITAHDEQCALHQRHQRYTWCKQCERNGNTEYPQCTTCTKPYLPINATGRVVAGGNMRDSGHLVAKVKRSCDSDVECIGRIGTVALPK